MADANYLARLEAYSDGVFAVASTLLALEIKVPTVGIQAPVRRVLAFAGRPLAMSLARPLASMNDDNGRVLVERFYGLVA